jgi:hypothetical protein
MFFEKFAGVFFLFEGNTLVDADYGCYVTMSASAKESCGLKFGCVAE